MLNLRKLHRYLGVFFAPAILFFAFSGALQTFGLHESEHRGEPPPVAWIAAIAALHKDQHFPEVRAQAPRVETAIKQPPQVREAPSPTAGAAPHEKKSTLPLKLFVLALSIGLCVTTVMGLVLALSNPRSRKATGIMLVLGTLVPLMMLFV